MSQITNKHHRPAVFFAREVQEELVPGEWLRSAEKSGPRIAEQIDEFLSKQQASIAFISNPTVSLIESAERYRNYLIGVSILYEPHETVLDNKDERNPTHVSEPIDITNKLDARFREELLSIIAVNSNGLQRAGDQKISTSGLPRIGQGDSGTN